MAGELPDELIVQILSFLPAKSLLLCRSVCKAWLNLISSTDFKVMHLHNFNQLISRYFIRRLDYWASEEWFCVHFDDEAFTLDSGTQIEFPFDSIRANMCFWIVGCCNGVVCLSDFDEFNEDGFTLDTIILWNPSIRRKLTLPLPIFYDVSFEDPTVVLGFGYDNISDDFKVVCLTYHEYYPKIRPKVEVYTLKTGIWREVIFPNNLRCFNIRCKWSQIFFNGCLHWIAYDPIPRDSLHMSIMTFDITTELFGEIELPQFLAKKFTRVSVVGESLAIIHSSDLNFDGVKSGSTYMVMVMKEHKNPASWTMLYHIHFEDLDLGKPLRLRSNGDMIVELENKDMLMFDHDEGCCVYVFLDGEEEDFGCKTYVDKYEESLALLDVGDSVPNKEAMKALMIIENQESGHGLDDVARHE